MDRMMLAGELVKMAREVVSLEFPTDTALRKYLKEHPGADKSKHSVKKVKMTHPADAGPKELSGLSTTSGFKKALREHAGGDDPEALKEAAASFHKAATSRKKQLQKTIVKFMRENGGKDFSTRGLLSMANLGKQGIEEGGKHSMKVKQRAKALYDTHAHLGNVAEMAKEAMG